jgi:hypothetical protein
VLRTTQGFGAIKLQKNTERYQNFNSEVGKVENKSQKSSFYGITRYEQQNLISGK